jgi:hypothetical protein
MNTEKVLDKKGRKGNPAIAHVSIQEKEIGSFR